MRNSFIVSGITAGIIAIVIGLSACWQGADDPDRDVDRRGYGHGGSGDPLDGGVEPPGDGGIGSTGDGSVEPPSDGGVPPDAAPLPCHGRHCGHY